MQFCSDLTVNTLSIQESVSICEVAISLIDT